MSQLSTQLCYSLEEAAQALNLSETVLVRLSQYFKVPAAAYEEVGYLSFKGDLMFSEPDLAFFRRVKERLVAGDTLEQARQKVPYGVPPSSPRKAEHPPENRPLNEMQDASPYRKAAERDFARYKSANRNSIGQVFSKMLKEVNTSPASPKKSSAPDAKPMREKTDGLKPKASPAAKQSERLLPFRRKAPPEPQQETTQPLKSGMSGLSSAWEPTQPVHIGWERLIQDAVQQPRVLNQHLKAAALILREQALHRKPR